MIEIKTPDGFQPIGKFVEKPIMNINKFVFNDGITIKATDNHLFQMTSDEWVYAKDLEIGCVLKSINGESTLVGIIPQDDEEVVDIEILHSNHRYYTNGIVSHNTGGNALRFYLSASYLLTWSSRVKEQVENEMTDEIEDIEVANKYTIKNIKNKVSRPFKKSKYIIRFGEGTDDISIIYDRLKDVGRITNKGSFLDYHAHNEDLNFRENGKLRFHEKFITEEILADAIIQYKESFKAHLSNASSSDTNDEIFDDDINDGVFDGDINDATEL